MITHLFKKIIYVFSFILLFFDNFSEISFKNCSLRIPWAILLPFL